MHWKTVGAKEYLYRTLDGKGTAKSLGARSTETQAIAGPMWQHQTAAAAGHSFAVHVIGFRFQ
ncbi:MAG: hypothetical protein QM533_07805 [Cytophagales bacterium]|nr:hypothetical protein [Cytophagales bacterium]